MPAGSWQQSSGTAGQALDHRADQSAMPAPLVGYGPPLGILLLELEHVASPVIYVLGVWVLKTPERCGEKALHHHPCANAASTPLATR